MTDEYQIEIAKIKADVKHTEQSTSSLYASLLKHMDKEELAFDKLYSRLRAMEKELHRSFQERDKVISDIRMQQTRLLAYATTAFAMVSIGAQYFL